MSEGGWMDQEAIESERLDADIEMMELENAARNNRALVKAGKCPHGWCQPRTAYNGNLCSAELSRSPIGSVECFDCKRILTPEQAREAGIAVQS